MALVTGAVAGRALVVRDVADTDLLTGDVTTGYVAADAAIVVAMVIYTC